jgi:hypothetical protein
LFRLFGTYRERKPAPTSSRGGADLPHPTKAGSRFLRNRPSPLSGRSDKFSATAPEPFPFSSYPLPGQAEPVKSGISWFYESENFSFNKEKNSDSHKFLKIAKIGKFFSQTEVAVHQSL